jgi:hypothetical protein
MPLYQLIVDELHRSTYYVEADNHLDAIRKVKHGSWDEHHPALDDQSHDGYPPGAEWYIVEKDQEKQVDVQTWTLDIDADEEAESS